MEAHELARKAHQASVVLRSATTTQKNRFLSILQDELRNGEQELLAANEQDLSVADEGGISEALRDRLLLNASRIQGIISAVSVIEELPDPVGEQSETVQRPSGIVVSRMSVPLGVVLMVYESRPNVTIEAGALALKSGNAVILKGGKEARHSIAALGDVLRRSLRQAGLPEDSVQYIGTSERKFLYELLKQKSYIDLVIPRGGTSLIEAVSQHSTIPVLQHYQGICHVYVHESADVDNAKNIILNSKTQRPGVCNALECIVIDRAFALKHLSILVEALCEARVEIRACSVTRDIIGKRDGVFGASDEDFDTEFLSMICAIKIVEDLEEALHFISEHGSHHTEAIVAEDESAIDRFLREVDASCVVANASTRFNDGGELGLGAELGISTTKLHAYGPMGLRELCTKKFVVRGNGQIRT
ncbi:MAG: glutamate-5-semialdehyde dehydrogenase [Bdellovibrionales bacterium]|nr:glutamate-5-semialdehyde dehydrogenase [Bdellovibrionales bacterium]